MRGSSPTFGGRKSQFNFKIARESDFLCSISRCFFFFFFSSFSVTRCLQEFTFLRERKLDASINIWKIFSFFIYFKNVVKITNWFLFYWSIVIYGFEILLIYLSVIRSIFTCSTDTLKLEMWLYISYLVFIIIHFK